MTAVTPGSAEQLRSAERLVTEFEDIFGDITATERKWLVEGIGRLAAKPAEEGPSFQPANVRAWLIATPFTQCEEWPRYVDHMLKALSSMGEPKR